MDNYKEKIKKLLALAESPNEHEAKAALLKARQLMAEHKIIEADLKDVGKQEVKSIKTEITCSKRRNPWIIGLSGIIGENYCCRAYRTHGYGKQTQAVSFIGFEDDVEICASVFKYAVDCIVSGIKEIQIAKSQYYDSGYVKSICDSYGYGFAYGIQQAFKDQQNRSEEGWGLVMVVPKEVDEATKHFGKQGFNSKAGDNLNPSGFGAGFEEGKKFKPMSRIEGGEAV